MERIEHWVLHNNRNLVVDSEELSALQLIGKVGTKTNEVVDKTNELENYAKDIDNKKVTKEEFNKYKSDNLKDLAENRKLSPVGNFTGSWHGVSRPSQANEGVTGLLDLHTEQLQGINTQLAEKVNKDIDTVYFNEYAKLQGVIVNKTTDISTLLQYCVNNYKYIIMPCGYEYRIAKSITITKNCNIYCDGTVYVDDNINAFIIGALGSDKRIERNVFKFNKIWGNGKQTNSTFISLQHAIYNQFEINYAENLGKVIELKPISPQSSLGENQFKIHLWYGCNIAFHIMGSDTWENRTWAEGSQLINGFISGCNYGIKIEPNVLYSGMYVTTAIDNMEIENSWDYYNGGNESPDYQIANLLLFRFIRFARCQFKNIDSFWDCNLKLKTTGEIQSHGALRQEGTEGNWRTNNGQTEVYNNTLIYTDYKNTLENDYDVRVSVENGELEYSSKTSSAFKVTKDGFKISRSGMNVPIVEGQNNIVINHTYGIANNKFTVVCVPSWATSYHLEVKNTTGFKLVFSTPAPSSATIDYFIILGN